jgi:outer membrane receptor protein involved in Fe transport
MKAKFVILFVLLACAAEAPGGSSGKIAGRVRDAGTGEVIVGASVIVEGTTTGASTDVEGRYTIINVPPGTYTVSFSGVGLQKKRFTNVRVNVDFTTTLDVDLVSEAIALETIEVRAEAPMIRRDLTSSHTVVDASVIQALPVESVTQILTLQAGITQGAGGELHIRGGRSNEIQYAVNGVSIASPFDNSRTVDIATNAIEELSVVSGTFNAEYGRALSGIVNTVTKEGGGSYHATLSAYSGDKVSNRTGIFPSIDKVQAFNTSVLEGTLSGPVIGSNLTFFLSGRRDYDRGWLYGVREHNPTDYVYKNPTNPNDIRVISTGDSALVSMNSGWSVSATGKLSFTPDPLFKVRYDILYSRSEGQGYSHDLKYNPDANPTGYEWGLVNALEIRHALGASTYYTLKGYLNLNDYKAYLYPLVDQSGRAVDYWAGSPLDITALRADARYQPDYKLITASSYTFLAGGTSNAHSYRRSVTYGGKFDLLSQVNPQHELKLGAEYRLHRLDYEYFTVLCDTVRYFTPTIPSTRTAYHDRYYRWPVEISGYVQDKMEFMNMVLNVGLRYDMFWSRSNYGTDMFYPSPNDPTLPPQIDPGTLLAGSSPKHQISPRLGISFPITDRGIIHFSYGHFFQMPPFVYLYANPDFKYNAASGSPTFGNADLNPEKTVTYEIGLQQQLLDNLSFTVTGFYKDVRDLLALHQIRVSGSSTYYKYINKDYANIRGITFSLFKRRSPGDLLGVTLDYTFQVAEGNETSANAFFTDLSSGRQSEKLPVYLDWDQTHTLNATVSVGAPGDWNVSVVGRLASGLPYTPQITEKTVYLVTNSGRKPSIATVDLLADKTLALAGVRLTAFLKVFNLFDTLNERYVYDDTGSAGYTLVASQGTAQYTDELARTVPGVHSASEYFVRPQYYRSPREVRVGLSLEL